MVSSKWKLHNLPWDIFEFDKLKIEFEISLLVKVTLGKSSLPLLGSEDDEQHLLLLVFFFVLLSSSSVEKRKLLKDTFNSQCT